MAIGSYAVERDYSHYVAYAAKTVLAVVGTATKGPIGVATVCTSTQDLVNKFGPLKTDCFALYAGQYFLSQSSKLYFVRAASDSAAASTTTVPVLVNTENTEGTFTDTENTEGTGKEDTPQKFMTVSFNEKGTYSNGYKLLVNENVDDDGKIISYNLKISNTVGTTLELLNDVKFENLVPGYRSTYINIVDVPDGATSLTPGVYVFSKGNDGISDIKPADYISAASTLEVNAVDMNLIAVPGVYKYDNDFNYAEVIIKMIDLAETRGDCLYLVDPPKGLNKDEVMDWHNGAGKYENKHSAFNSSYAALYYDWVEIYDSVNKVRVTVPPSVVVAATYAYSDRITELWYAPAGLTRGLVRGALNSVTKLSKSDVATLYSDSNNINSIYDDPQVGMVLWGQKTLFRENSALNRVNVRKLLNYLKRVVTAACNYLTFEPNDRLTWNSFEMKVMPVLESIKNRRGIYEYRIVQGETIVTNEDIDNYRMPCMIMIRPTKAAEEIPIYFTITSTGADFNEVLESNGVVTV